MLLERFRDQVTARNLQLLLGDISVERHHLHAVIERFGDLVQIVRRGDEQDLREITGDVEIVILEVVVLRGVEHLEHGA